MQYRLGMALPPFAYSPFRRRLDELDGSDLSQLRDAAEGWHVDYKRDVPTIDSAQKSLSSFANMFGGWVLYGVDAPGSGSPYPTGFPGIEEGHTGRLMEVLQRAATQITPPPFFAVKVIKGPDSESGLPAGRSVIVVRVPPGADAPYIHNNGRIYRRVADSSEPRHETDRHVLDLLWQRSNSARDIWDSLVSQEFALSKGESDQTLMHMFLSCDPYGDRGIQLDMEFVDFVSLMRSSTSESGGIRFDNFFSGPGCFIARQISNNDPFRLVLTWRQFFNGTAIVSVPINSHGYDDTRNTLLALSKYRHTDALKNSLSRISLSHGRILDLNVIPFMLTESLQKYRRLLGLSKIDSDFVAKIRVDNVWRTTPFVDLAAYVSFIDEHGPPLIQQDSVFAPAGVDTMHYLECWHDDVDRRLADSLQLFTQVCVALGLWLMPSAVLVDYSQLYGRTFEE